MAMLAFILIMDSSYAAVFGILSAIIHELGHVIAIVLKDGKVKELKFGLVNVDMLNEASFTELRAKDEFFILLSGSILNFACAFVFISVYFLLRMSIFKVIAIQNLFIGAVNLLPISSLDGGRILSIFISQKLDLELSEKILDITSFIFLVPLGVLGFMILIKSRYNFSLLILGLYLLSYILFKEDSHI